MDMPKPLSIEKGSRRLMRRISPRVAAHTDRLAAVADQGFAGLAITIMMAILTLRLSSPALASAGLMLGIYYLAFTVHRGAVVLPFIVSEINSDGRMPDGAWWLIHVAVTASVTATLTIAGLILVVLNPFWASEWILQGLFGAAIMAPFLLTWEFGKRWLYQQGYPTCAAIGSAIYFVAMIAAVFPSRALGPFSACLAWSVAGLSASVWTFSISWPTRVFSNHAATLFRPHKAFALLQALAGLPHILYNVSAVVLFGLALGSRGAAAYTLVRTLLNPGIAIVSAIDSTEKPRAAHAFQTDGLDGLKSVVAKTRLMIAATVGPYLTFVALFGGAIVQNKRGMGDHLSWFVPILAVAFLLGALAQPSETFLTIRRRSTEILAARTALAAGALSLVVAGGARFGLLGSGAGFLIAQSANLLLFFHLQSRESIRASAGFNGTSLGAFNGARPDQI